MVVDEKKKYYKDLEDLVGFHLYLQLTAKPGYLQLGLLRGLLSYYIPACPAFDEK